jgi:glycosyltransferase involved in cell wall biosynthesis
MRGPIVALDTTAGRLGRAGPHVYVTELTRALGALLGERLQPIASRWAREPNARRTTGDRLRTLGRDLWWHQVGVSLAARRRGADVLHLPAGLGPIRPRVPTVVTIHDATVLRFPNLFRPWQRWYSGFVVPRLARSAAAVITVSQAAKADLVEHLGIPADRIAVVPNGVAADFTRVPAQSAAARDVAARYHLPAAFALTVGAIEPRKNLPRLLEAVRRLRTRPATADLTLVHAGPEGWMAGAVASGDGVRFVGYVPTADLRVLYSLARVFVYPSLWEGFGLPVAEAMACGCPVVTSNVSALPELAGDAALLVNPESVEEIAAAIERLWSDEPLRCACATRGRLRVTGFTWERAARATAAVYESVAP